MKMLVIMRDNFRGCGFYRMYQPHNHLAKNYKVNVLITDGLKHFSDERLKEYDIAIWQKGWYDFTDIDRAKNLGLATFADFDDHWILPKDHVFYKAWQKDGTVTNLHKLLLKIDNVICTTDRLADEICKHNSNVYVLPNAMDMNYEGCKVERVKEDKFVFGYLGGHTHYRDVMLLEGLQRSLDDIKGYNLRLFGYDETSLITITLMF